MFWRLDVIGLLLLTVSLGCLLVPLTLAGGIKETWKSSYHCANSHWSVLIPVFLLWEGYGARDPIIPLHLMKDRGIWSVVSISLFFDFVFAVESNFLYTVLMVAVNESQSSATRIASLSSFVSVVTGFIFGLFVVYFRRLKGFVVFGCAMWMVAFGIMYHFRSQLHAHAGIIGGMCLMDSVPGSSHTH